MTRVQVLLPHQAAAARVRLSAPAPRELHVELVPRTCWWSNVRTLLGARAWARLRRAVYAAADHTCEVCGARNVRVEAHEVWEYDEVTCVQKLARMICLCPRCHEVKHFGHAVHAHAGARAREHLRRVNHWTADAVEAHIRTAYASWHRRSRLAWTCDVGVLTSYGVDVPEMPGRRPPRRPPRRPHPRGR